VAVAGLVNFEEANCLRARIALVFPKNKVNFYILEKYVPVGEEINF
jgi:hypothetical protein